MIDNFKRIKEILDRVATLGYTCQVKLIYRGKDLPEDKKHLNGRTITNYYIGSSTDLEEIRQEICEIVKATGCRAYINLNPKNYHGIAKDYAVEVVRRVTSGIYENLEMAYGSVHAQAPSSCKILIADWDSKTPPTLEDMQLFSKPRLLPTPNGFHILYERQDDREFRKKYPDVEIKKNALTILYAL